MTMTGCFPRSNKFNVGFQLRFTWCGTYCRWPVLRRRLKTDIDRPYGVGFARLQYEYESGSPAETSFNSR